MGKGVRTKSGIGVAGKCVSWLLCSLFTLTTSFSCKEVGISCVNFFFFRKIYISGRCNHAINNKMHTFTSLDLAANY